MEKTFLSLNQKLRKIVSLDTDNFLQFKWHILNIESENTMKHNLIKLLCLFDHNYLVVGNIENMYSSEGEYGNDMDTVLKEFI